MEKSVLMATEGIYSVIFATFLRESIGHIIPWLIVTFCVIICDLVVGLRKSIMMGEEVRFSSACRRTLGKCVSYFMFVIMVAVIDVAAHGGELIDKWSCLLVCFIEGCSIINNILKPKGMSLDIKRLIEILIGKKLDIKLDGVIKEDKNESQNK